MAADSEAALDSNCHYLDINDDWEPTIEMLQFHEKAESNLKQQFWVLAQVQYLTNMLGAAAIEELDEVETLYTTPWMVPLLKKSHPNQVLTQQ